KKSEALFRDILRADASHVAALCGLAALSLAADVPHDAERLLRHALKQSEHVPLAYRGLGPALLALGRIEEADAAARHLLKMEPGGSQELFIQRCRGRRHAAPAYGRQARAPQ